MTLVERVALEPLEYEPVKRSHRGKRGEKLLYDSHLLEIDDAIQLLGKDTIAAEVVRQGWQAIQLRYSIELQGLEFYGIGIQNNSMMDVIPR